MGLPPEGRRRGLARAGAIALACIGALSSAPLAAQSHQDLVDAERNERDWLYATHDYAGTRFSVLDEIDASNVHRLAPVCMHQLGALHNFQTNPIVHDGVMYVTTHLLTVALDARSCRVLWRHEWLPRAAQWWEVNRGVALKDGVVVRGTADGYLIALEASSGDELWVRAAADAAAGESFTMNPLVFDDLILIGTAGSENAVMGWVAAFRLADGEEVWRFHTVPRPGDPGSETWGNPYGIQMGGGAVWTPLSLDAERGALFVAVTNPSPDLPAEMRPGANLYTNSIVALDVRTGALVWYDQLVPNDAHDYDLTQVHPLFRARVAGRERDVVATAGKDGLMHLLDRASGERLWSAEVARREGVDVPLTREGVYVCPGILGGVEWNGPAYNPDTGLLYVPAVNLCGTFGLEEPEQVGFVPGRMYLGGFYEADPTSRSGWLTAVEASTGDVRWRYESELPLTAAVTTTAGGVVFTGEQTGDFIALDARDGEVLYRFHTGGQIGGGVVTYSVDGKQYVAVASGRISAFWRDNAGAPTVVVFALPD